MARQFKLTHCKLNESLIIEKIDGPDESILRKLAALGLMEGRKIRLLQKRLAYVIACDYTQVAVDQEVADCITVYRDS